MLTTLKEIKEAMNGRLETAHTLLLQDTKQAIKASLKSIPPLVIVLQDIARQGAEKAGKTKLQPAKIEIEVILTDDKVLKDVPADLDDALLAQEIRDKASFGVVISDLGEL
jgi:hypothetical protein